MTTNHCLLLAAVAAAVLLTATSAANTTTPIPSPYDMLGQYGFPPGIIPQGVQSYDLRQDGSFEVDFSGDCAMRIGGFKIRYSSRVAGNIQNGTITGLEGVKVKIVIAWVRIREVSRDGDEIRVHAGSISKAFPVDDFSVSPQC
jgi:hypothetical protein